MSNEKTISVARAVQVQIHAVEEAIDSALSEAATLIETYVTSRRALNLAATRSVDINENTLKAMQALNEAQAHMAAAHKGLSRVRQHIGVAPEAMMPAFDTEKPPEPAGRLAARLVTA